jgi:hypothetical protein
VNEQEPATGVGKAGMPGASPASHQELPALHGGDFGHDVLTSATSRLGRRRLDPAAETNPPADIAASERALGNLLNVIKAEAQLLERSVRRADRHQPERTGARLTAIITMVDEAAVELVRLSRLRAQSAKRP